MSARQPLVTLLRTYIERDAAGAAATLETMEEDEALQVLGGLPPALASQVFPHLHAKQAASLLSRISQETFDAVAQRLRPEETASLLLHLPPERRQALLERTTARTKREIGEFLAYPENSAGRIMSTDFLAFHVNIRVRDAVQKLRAVAQRQAPMTYTYVVDQDNRLVGVLNMRDLLLAQPDAALESVMRKDLFTVNGFMDREDVAHQLSERDYFAAPVVDNDGRLLGVVKSEQLLEDVQEEATEDILRMVGAGVDERTFSPMGFSLRKRLPWLYVNLATAFLAAAVVALFEDVIARITVLAVFLPVVAGQGGNAGAQSLAVVMRGLVMREINPLNAKRLLAKETVLGALNGLLIGLVTAAIAWVWEGKPFLGVVIGLAMIVNLTVAGLFGALIPLMLKAMGRDPAQSSSIFLTTVTDVIGFFAFLGFAVLFQGFLL